jgi:phage terminase Nu1 subunit (DNA packaging protein)
MSFGVAAGTTTAIQLGTVNSGMPASANVGTSGRPLSSGRSRSRERSFRLDRVISWSIAG